MPSNAYTNHLLVLLRDATELHDAHVELRTGQVGRQWGLGALNRAVVVLCVSAWESYVEEIVRESLESFRPIAPAPLSTWQALNASARSQIGRFNTPNPDNVRMLISDAIGLQDVTPFWNWRNCTPSHARNLLSQALTYRHQIAHGVNPRPIIHNQYSGWLPGFFERLGLHTDNAIRDHLVNVLAVAAPWPL